MTGFSSGASPKTIFFFFFPYEYACVGFQTKEKKSHNLQYT